MSMVNILSKSAPLEVSIANMERILREVGCEVRFSKELHPLKNCFSINLSSTQAPNHIYSNGKGTMSKASTASALGEYIERLQTNNFFIDFHLPQRAYYPDEKVFEYGGAYLNDTLQELYDVTGELDSQDLVDFNSDFDDKIVALPFRNTKDDKCVYFPLNILSNLYLSNGLEIGRAHV